MRFCSENVLLLALLEVRLLGMLLSLLNVYLTVADVAYDKLLVW